jgi:hypothetical protein
MRSVAAFRRTQKLAIARAAYQTYLDSQKVGEAKVGDAPVLETVIRTPFDNSIDPQEIAFDLAKWEMSKWATVHNTTGTDFEKYEGKQVDYLIEIDGLFFEPTKKGAIAELLNEGIVIRTRLAEYKTAVEVVVNENEPNPAMKPIAQTIFRMVGDEITPEIEWYLIHGKYPNRIRFSVVSKKHYVIGDDTWNRINPTKQENIFIDTKLYTLAKKRELEDLEEPILNPCDECGGETESKYTGYEKDICGACRNE